MIMTFQIYRMGNSCSHERTRVLRVIDSDKGIISTSQIVEVECLDCLTNGEPTVIRKENVVGNLTGHVYSQKSIDKKKCCHKKFDVDESTIQKKSEPTLEGTLMGMFTAGWFETRHHYLVGKATCNRCNRTFWVECDYHTENKWENYEKRSVEVRKQWKIVEKSVPDTHATKKEIAYVD